MRDFKVNRLMDRVQLYKEAMVTEVEYDFSKNLPFKKVGETVRIRSLDGEIKNGILEKRTNEKVILRTEQGLYSFHMDEIDALSLFQIHSDFRKEVCEWKAALNTYAFFIQEDGVLELLESPHITSSEKIRIGDPDAMFELAESYRLTGEVRKAFFLYGFLAKEGDSDAELQIGLMYLDGNPIGSNFALSENLIQQAAEAGNERAGELLNEWREMATDNGSNLSACRHAGNSATINESRSLSNLHKFKTLQP
jgi:hypothetical protein